MTTRRTLLRLAGAAAGATVLGGAAACERRIDRAGAAEGPERLVVRTDGGLAVFGTAGPVVPAGPGFLDAYGGRLVRTTGGSDVVVHDISTGRESARVGLREALQPRVLSVEGRLVALATPGDATAAPYRPAGRAATTIVVAEAGGGALVRVRLPGNLEPEAFTADGKGLFVLDYLPPTAPDRYRVRLVDLAEKRLQPLLTRVKTRVPTGAEEEMRGEGRQAVYHRTRQLLFTLYTHQGGHLHTRDLRGVRRDAPGVHAFVHTLSLNERWAYCVNLPAPFGEHPAAGHAIALSDDGFRVAVVEAVTGTLGIVDPQGLTVAEKARFAPLGGGPAAAAFAADGRLVVGAGHEVVVLADETYAEAARWTCPAPVRGLAVHPDKARVYAGQPDHVACHDLATGRLLCRIAAPGLLTLQALTVRR